MNQSLKNTQAFGKPRVHLEVLRPVDFHFCYENIPNIFGRVYVVLTPSLLPRMNHSKYLLPKIVSKQFIGRAKRAC